MLVLIGPEVPEHIKKTRSQRRSFVKENVEFEQPEPVEAPQSGSAETKALPEPDSDSDSDDFGPPLPVTDADAEAAEKEALARLNERALAAEPEEKLSDRGNWMSLALGESQQISHDPKTFRRRPAAGVDSSWSETQGQRSKRLADEMMGLSSESKKKPKNYLAEDEPVEDERIGPERPSLLEEHRARRNNDDEEKDEKFVFRKGSGTSNKNLEEFVSRAKQLGSRFEHAK